MGSWYYDGGRMNDLKADGLKKPEWVHLIKKEITDILQGDDALIKKIDSIAHLVIRERAQIVQELVDLRAPTDWE